MIEELLLETDDHMDKTVEHFKRELSGVRTGRASAAILDGITVDYYGTPTPINQMATITVPEARMLCIQPWEANQINAVVKAISASDLGLNPTNDGKLIRLPFPALTEERRKELVKHTRNVAEENRVAVRNIRRDAIEQLKKAEKASDITEDDLHRSEKDVQDLTDNHIKAIDEALATKETEIMEI